MHNCPAASAEAHPNIALVKYWGKRADSQANEPAVASLSITLDTLVTRTRLRFDESLVEDRLTLNGELNPVKQPRISAALDILRRLANIATRCHIESDNNFPTGAGLASSASGFAALVVAGDQALKLGLSVRQKSMLARAMSGSAARSLFGGYSKIVLSGAGEDPAVFGQAFAQAVAEREHWPLEVCVAIVSEEEKAIGSTEGMESSRRSSPYYNAWVSGNNADIALAERAVAQRDFSQLAELSEFSCLKMHALALASNPGLIYWAAPTLAGIHVVRSLRKTGVPVFFTIDAGPQLKAVCLPGHGDTVAGALQAISGVKKVLRCGLGAGAHAID